MYDEIVKENRYPRLHKRRLSPAESNMRSQGYHSGEERVNTFAWEKEKPGPGTMIRIAGQPGWKPNYTDGVLEGSRGVDIPLGDVAMYVRPAPERGKRKIWVLHDERLVCIRVGQAVIYKKP